MSENSSNSKPRYYSGGYTHGVDEKRRVQIPAKWRPNAEDTELTLILWDNNGSAGACLRVYPPAQMEATMRKIEEMPTSDPAAVALRRRFARNCEGVTMDKSGRICIPEEMAKKAGIEKQVALAGMFQWFEIWNPERLEAASAGDDVLAQERMRTI